MKPPPRVPYNIRVSTQYLNALALGIYNLSVKNQKIFTASALFSYVSENCIRELDALNAKDLLLYAPKDSLKGDVRVSYLLDKPVNDVRSEEHTSELQSLMRISYAVFCLKKKIINTNATQSNSILQQNMTKTHKAF